MAERNKNDHLIVLVQN